MLMLNNKLDFSKSALTSIVHGLLLLPILNLLMTINNMPGKRLLFTFFIFTHLSALFFKKSIYFSVQLVASFIFLYVLFPPSEEALRFREWVAESWTVGYDQWNTLLAADLTEVPDLLLTTGLLILITLLTVLLLHFKLALPSFFSGLVYLLILHTFTSRTVLPYLIPLIGLGFLLIALTQISTESSWVSFAITSSSTALFTLVVIILAYLGLDRLKPTQEWVETKSNAYQRNLDNRGFFEWINNQATGLGFRRTGMGTDDTELGGRLHQDFSPVFRAYTSRPHYWKVLHRTEYTGKGWKSDYDDDYYSVSSPYNIWLTETASSDQREELLESEDVSTISIDWAEQLSYLTYPYGWFDLELAEADSEYELDLNIRSNYFRLQGDTDDVSEYTLAYDRTFPDRMDEEALRVDDGWRAEAVQNFIESDTGDFEEEINRETVLNVWFEEELHIPTSLPQRVIDLAEEITEGLDNEYDIVRAIESYLKEDGGYRYSLLDVENTPEGGDYVDHFLFESEVGYCDNFSTSMTIMLRAVGIPARWTKGFTPGSLIVNENNEEYFQVDNSNAHSWPEVYFPSYGWIPFEPSPSFANPVTSTESVATVRGETYSFDDDDTIDIEEEDLEIDPSTEEESPETSVDDVLEPGEDGDVSDQLSESASDTQEPSEREWFYLFYPFAALIAIIASVLAIFRWYTLLWFLKWLVNANMLTSRQASSLVLRLYHLKLKPSTAETIETYFNRWKPYVSGHSDLFDQFSKTANEAFYRPKMASQHLTPEHKQNINDMLTLYPKLPRVNWKQQKNYF